MFLAADPSATRDTQLARSIDRFHEEAEVDVPRRLKLLVDAGHQPRRLIVDLPLEGLARRRPSAADSITNKWESHKSKIGANGPNSATAARARWRKGGKPQKPRRSSSSSPRPPVRGWDPILTHQADNIPARWLGPLRQIRREKAPPAVR
jgi:hypothetical protein